MGTVFLILTGVLFGYSTYALHNQKTFFRNKNIYNVFCIVWFIVSFWTPYYLPVIVFFAIGLILFKVIRDSGSIVMTLYRLIGYIYIGYLAIMSKTDLWENFISTIRHTPETF